MMNKKTILFAFLAGFLVLSMAGCKDSPPPPYWLLDGDGAGLVGKWYSDSNDNGTVDPDEEKLGVIYEFTSTGKILQQGSDFAVTFQPVDSDTITIYISGLKMGTIDWAVSGKRLTITGSPVAGLAPGKYAKK
jgi:hypothetical protein